MKSVEQTNVQNLRVSGTWRDVADAARTTAGLEAGSGEPSSNWKSRMLLCEHSPIRVINVTWEWVNLPYWVSVHLVRHKIGIEHFVKSQRTDRTGVSRDALRQDAPVTHRCTANLQSIINISRMRLCGAASPETTHVWSLFLFTLSKVEPEVVERCVPQCVYRGFCTEYRTCGFQRTGNFELMLAKYRIK
jgi:hypothetical protein